MITKTLERVGEHAGNHLTYFTFDSFFDRGDIRYFYTIKFRRFRPRFVFCPVRGHCQVR